MRQRPEFLLDTNIISEPRKPRPDPKTMARLRDNEGLVAMASVVWHELVYGIERLPEGKRKVALRGYLHEVVAPTIPMLSYDGVAATWHARVRAALAASGLTPPFVDGQIAAVAAVNGLVLVTRNERDYQMFDGIQVERW